MFRRIGNRRFCVLPVAVKLFTLLILATVGTTAMLGQTCTVAPDKNGGPQYNQPRGLTKNWYGPNIPVAWPQGYKVDYIEHVGWYNTYQTYFPNDYIAAIIFAYDNWASANTNSVLSFEFYGTSINGLVSTGSSANPNFQPWHEWLIVHQAILPAPRESRIKCLWMAMT
jgi:hypothetical protein